MINKKTKEKTEPKIKMEMNLLQVALINRDIQQVKVLTSMAQKKDENTLRHPSQITKNNFEKPVHSALNQLLIKLKVL